MRDVLPYIYLCFITKHYGSKKLQHQQLFVDNVSSTARSLNISSVPFEEGQEKEEENLLVEILSQGPYHAVANKPPSIKCHNSDWTGPKNNEVAMLQRVRDTIGRRINLIHRLDRGASGCLLASHAEENCEELRECTKTLIEALQSPLATKTYVAIVRGEGVFKDEDFRQKGWFNIDRPIKDENGIENSANTAFRFVAGVNRADDGVRASLVLARPSTGRWHQIRRHLNGLSHPILGDSTHGNSRTNREWRSRGLPGERICLHLARMQLPPTSFIPSGLDVRSPIADDMMMLLRDHLPEVLLEAQSELKDEGIMLNK